MGTRCQVKVIEDIEKKKDIENVTLYRHLDGYPESVIPLFWEAFKYGVTPYIPDWDKDENPKKIDESWKAYRAGYVANFLCYVAPREIQPENSHKLHGDIAYYYKLYVKGAKVDNQKNLQWEVEIFNPDNMDIVLERSPLCNLVNEKGRMKYEILSKIP